MSDFFLLFEKILYMYAYFVWMYICISHALHGAHRDKNIECDALNLELQSVMSLTWIPQTKPMSSTRAV